MEGKGLEGKERTRTRKGTEEKSRRIMSVEAKMEETMGKAKQEKRWKVNPRKKLEMNVCEDVRMRKK